MFPKFPVVVLAVLFLASQVSCEASIKRTVALTANRVLLRSLKFRGAGLRGRQTSAVETEHTSTTFSLSADEKPVVPENDVAVNRKVEESACYWRDSTAMCDASQQARLAHLETSNNVFAQFVTQFIFCEAMSNEPSCISTGKCIWDKEEKRCQFYAIASGQKDSPCYKAAPGSIGLLTYGFFCGATSSKQACDKEPHCTWDEDERECLSDALQLLTGVSISEFTEAVETMSGDGKFFVKDLAKTAIISHPDFKDWDSILEWKLSKMECPMDIDPRLWDIVHAQMSKIVPIIFYCTVKYRGAKHDSECDRDPLCERKAFEYGCSMRESHFEVGISFLEDMLPLIDAKVDRLIVKSIIDCERLEEKGCKGKCIWDLSEDECVPKEDWMLGEIVAAGKDKDDALCRYLAVEVESGCHSDYGEKKCSAKQQCAWRPFDKECMATMAYLLKAVKDTDPTSNRSLDMLRRHCRMQTTERGCLSVPQMTVT